jgi:hypothetical protein
MANFVLETRAVNSSHQPSVLADRRELIARERTRHAAGLSATGAINFHDSPFARQYFSFRGGYLKLHSRDIPESVNIIEKLDK